MPDPLAQDDRIVLTLKKFVQQMLVDELALYDIDVSVQREIFGGMLLQFRARILTDNLPPATVTERQRVTYEVPASTWQMWKARHAQYWYARRIVARWPVRYAPDPDGRGTDAVCTFDLERFRTYPKARVYLPSDRYGMPVLDHIVSVPRWNFGHGEEAPGA